MNVYDFDKTIYNGDATLDFWRFCLRRSPGVWLALPWQLLSAARYALQIWEKTRFKEGFYCFLPYVKNVDKAVEDFWRQQEQKLYPWYLAQKTGEDVVISASPEFLLSPICEKLGVHAVIASRVDKHTGKYTGKNCYGEEKPKRFARQFPLAAVDGFYTDSLSDLPMLLAAQRGYLVKKGVPVPFEGKAK